MGIAEEKYRRRLKAGELLFQQGDTGDAAYVIESGAIEIFTPTPEGRHVLARLGQDEIFGEMTLAGDHTRTASAAAVEDTVLSIITHEKLAERLANADPLLRHLLHVTMNRTRDSMRRMRGETGSLGAAAPKPAVVGGEADRSTALRRLRMEQEMEAALEAGHFQLHFQPITKLADGSVAGFESLIRWIKPDGTRIPPDRFIGVAEESGFIVPLGRWIIRTACAGLRRLNDVHRKSGQPLFVTINLSIRQFQDPDLFEIISSTLAQEGLQPECVKLEITESLVMGNMDASLALLNACKGMGCKLAVDDFGTGYSSLSYLHKFPVDVLKLDRSFIKDMAESEPAGKIVRAVAGLADDLGMETVVEGVETADQVVACYRAGINYAQGFHYSPALPLEEAAKYLQKTAISG